jgi:hypothetical protein
MDKVVATTAEAVADVASGASLTDAPITGPVLTGVGEPVMRRTA